jgi:predicted  nucleic acid-binding Zn-ribbon protein
VEAAKVAREAAIDALTKERDTMQETIVSQAKEIERLEQASTKLTTHELLSEAKSV